MTKIVIGLFILLLVSSEILYAQFETYNQEWRWAHFATESGLPSNDVLDVIETQQGIPWASTIHGLVWYDGFRWRLPKDASLPNKQATWLAINSEDMLFVVIDSNVYIGDTNGFTIFNYRRDQGIPLINAIVQIGKDEYLVVADTLIYSCRHGALTPTVQPASLAVPGRKFFYTSGRDLWINTRKGIFRWDGTNWTLKLPASDEPYGILGLVEGHSRENAFASISHPFNLRGLWEWKINGQPFHNFNEGQDFLQAMDISPSGEVVTIYRSGDVRVLRGVNWSTLNPVPNELKNATFLKFRNNGDLWVGTKSGLYLHKSSSTRWTYWKHSFPNLKNTINEILQTKDSSIWLGTEHGIEIHRVDGSVESFDNIDGKELFAVTGLCEDDEGGVWISSGSWFDGSYRWNGHRWKHFGAQEGLGALKIHKIRKDREGRLWFLGLGDRSKKTIEGSGTFVYVKGRFTQWGEQEGLHGGRVYAFDQGPDGALWFGTVAGLCRWKNGKWTYWDEHTGLKLSRIFTLAVDDKNCVWFGHQHGGLGSIDENNILRYFTVADGLASDEIWDLKFDQKGRLWVSTTDGLSCYDNDSWTSFNQLSGLEYTRLWAILPINNKVYVGTSGNGVNILMLDQLNTPDPKVELAEPIVEEGNVYLRWQPFSFWGVIPSTEILTRSRIDEYPWSEWTARYEKRISDAPVGDHLFQVQAKGLFGNYNLSTQSRQFTIEWPFYRRPQFVVPLISLSFAVIGLSLVLFIRKRKHDTMLRESEAKLRSVTETTSSAMFIDKDASFQFVNSSAELLTGYAKNELLLMSFHDIVHPDHREILKQHSGKWSRGTSPSQRIELKIITKEGVGRWADFTIGGVQYNGDQATLITAFDITERKSAEEKLLSYQKELKSLASDHALTEERDRRRMATYLHDSICQSLIFCKMKLAELRIAHSKTQVKSLAQEIGVLVDQSIENTQTLTFELSPPILYELGFEQAVQWLIERMYERHKLRIFFTDDRIVKPLGDDIRAVLFQAVSEALINIVKHALAKTASVSLQKDGYSIRIVIMDDGCGFDTSRHIIGTSRNSGFGLFNMRERIRHLGGEVNIESQIGRGTKIILSAPLKETQDNNLGVLHEH